MSQQPPKRDCPRIGRVQRRRSVRGSSPVVLVILILLVALFIFSGIAGSRGGMSKGGCLPTSAADRKALSDEWFSPDPPQKKHMSFVNCPRVGGVLRVKGECTIKVEPSGPEPTSYLDKIKAAFSDGPRGLPVEALTSAIVIDVLDRKDGSKRVEATLDHGGTTSITISRAGADITIRCVDCQVRIDRPKP